MITRLCDILEYEWALTTQLRGAQCSTWNIGCFFQKPKSRKKQAFYFIFSKIKSLTNFGFWRWGASSKSTTIFAWTSSANNLVGWEWCSLYFEQSCQNWRGCASSKSTTIFWMLAGDLLAHLEQYVKSYFYVASNLHELFQRRRFYSAQAILSSTIYKYRKLGVERPSLR